MRALISTIQPSSGGVPAKTRWLVRELASLGIHSTLAWYEPWSCSPGLSVTLPGLLPALLRGRSPGCRAETIWEDTAGQAVGSWLPELEFPHYWPTRHWRRLIASADLHLVTTGNPLCAHRYLRSGVPFLAWIGSSWHGDRVDRVRRFPWPRRLLDRSVNSPVLRHMERRVLRAPQGRILTISQYTAAELEAIGGRAPAGVLYLPPDAALFRPDPAACVPWRLGFAGRYGDPRKQLHLLLDAVRRLSQQGHPVRLELTGERQGRDLIAAALEHRGLDAEVHCHPYLSPAQLAGVMQRWDLFVIPSHQEGLCIAALEAMACGVPVVSTRCGGPEDFVLPGRTGELVGSDPAMMAATIDAICSDRSRRHQLGRGASAWVEAHAGEAAARSSLHNHLHALYPHLPLPA